MGNYSELKDLINNPTSHGLPAWDNGDNRIEGETMKSYLLALVNSLSSGGYLFAGVAKLTPTQTDPGTPDQNVFYIAAEPGTYTNFPISGGYLQVAENEVAIFKYNGQWSKETTGAATSESLRYNIDITSNFALLEDKIALGGVGSSAYFYPAVGICNVTTINKNDVSINDNKLFVVGSFPSVSRHLEFVDANNVVTRLITLSVGGPQTVKIDFESGETSVYVNAEDGLKVYTQKNIKDVITEHGEELDALGNSIKDKIPYFFAENIDWSLLTYRAGYINASGQYVSLASTSAYKVIELPVLAGDFIMIRSLRGTAIPALIWKSDGDDGYIKVVDDLIVGDIISTLGKMCISLVKATENTTFYISGNIGYAFEILKYAPNNTNDASSYKKIDEMGKVIEQIETFIGMGSGLEISYIAFGDSITYGVGATDFFGYPNKLNQHFGFASFSNRGISATSFCKQDNENGIIYTKTHELSNFAGLITVAGGTNDFGNLHSPLGSFDDIKDVPFSSLTPPSTIYSANYTFAEAFRYTIEDLQRNNPNAKIVVLIPTNRSNGTTNYGYGDLDAYREMEIKICKLLGVEYVDMSQCGIPSYNSSVYFRLNGGSPDGLHPNDFGYDLMTSFLIPRVNGYLQELNYRNSQISN